jgi:site-specific DNA-methyltransferase (adenine-specific)
MRVSNKLTARIKEKSRLTKDEWREYTKTVWQIANVTSPHHPAVFPAEIPKRLIKLFSFVNETILDPFAGIGSTADAAVSLGRKAVCIDQSSEYVEVMRKKCQEDLWRGIGVDIRCADSRDLGFLKSNSIGLVVTSPPYWNKASYGKEAANLGGIASYTEFIESLRPVFRECQRVLMPGRKLCVVTANVNQHTDFGLLTFPLAADITMLLRGLGMVMINEIIWSKDGTGGRWGSWGQQRPIFGSYPYPPNFLFKNVHEYILIFAKPSEQRTKGPKVVSLADIMRHGDRPLGPFVAETNGVYRTANGHHHHFGNGAHNGAANGRKAPRPKR